MNTGTSQSQKIEGLGILIIQDSAKISEVGHGGTHLLSQNLQGGGSHVTDHS